MVKYYRQQNKKRSIIPLTTQKQFMLTNVGMILACAREGILITIVVIAVMQDLDSMRISNRLILVGYVLALACSVIFPDLLSVQEGRSLAELLKAGAFVHFLVNISIPIVVLFLFCLMGAIGAGDIKLLSVIGGFVTSEEIVQCMMVAFGIGACYGLFYLSIKGELCARCMSAFRYLGDLANGNYHEYEGKYERKQMHFAIAIAIALFLVQGSRRIV